MALTFWSVFVFLFLASGPAFAVSADLLVRIGDELTQIKSKAESGDKLAREEQLYYFLGRYSENPEKKLAYFEQGIALSQSAKTKFPEHPGVILWWTANAGGRADLKRNLGALPLIRDIERALREMKEKNPDYGYAAADRALGRVYQRAPRFISVGSSSDAETSLRSAFSRFPDFPGNAAALAEFLLEEKKLDEARALATKVASSKQFKPGLHGDFSVEFDDWKETIDKVLRETEVRKR